MEVQFQNVQQMQANHEDIRDRIEEVRSMTIQILRHQPSIREVAEMQKHGEPAAEMIMQEGQKVCILTRPSSTRPTNA